MVIITSNNPFMKKFSRDNRMCSNDLCPAPQKLKDFSSGYTYCCNLDEFVYNMKRKYNTEFNGIIFPQKDIKFFEQESKKKTDLGDNLQRIID
uniref:Uncharacterized protein n=1 Tax=Megaselia scalaris TaxID=36166 RepID=T1GVG6_MEGSC